MLLKCLFFYYYIIYYYYFYITISFHNNWVFILLNWFKFLFGFYDFSDEFFIMILFYYDIVQLINTSINTLQIKQSTKLNKAK